MTTNDVSDTRISAERLEELLRLEIGERDRYLEGTFLWLKHDDKANAFAELIAKRTLASRTQSPAEWRVEAAAKAMAEKDGNGRNWQLYMPDARAALRAASITPPAPERSKEEVIPRLANCGKYLAQDNTGNWHYLNHAGTWQGFQGPQIEPATPLPVTITDEMVEALYTAIEAHIRTVPLSYGIEPQLTNRLRSVIRIGLHAQAAALSKPGEQG